MLCDPTSGFGGKRVLREMLDARGPTQTKEEDR
jgi:hypothetical protein